MDDKREPRYLSFSVDAIKAIPDFSESEQVRMWDVIRESYIHIDDPNWTPSGFERYSVNDCMMKIRKTMLESYSVWRKSVEGGMKGGRPLKEKTGGLSAGITGGITGGEPITKENTNENINIFVTSYVMSSNIFEDYSFGVLNRKVIDKLSEQEIWEVLREYFKYYGVPLDVDDGFRNTLKSYGLSRILLGVNAISRQGEKGVTKINNYICRTAKKAQNFPTELQDIEARKQTIYSLMQVMKNVRSDMYDIMKGDYETSGIKQTEKN